MGAGGRLKDRLINVQTVRKTENIFRFIIMRKRNSWGKNFKRWLKE